MGFITSSLAIIVNFKAPIPIIKQTRNEAVSPCIDFI
jgi:hypothetical protein